MRRVTVRWHHAAEEEVAELWMSDPTPALIERAANEIDQLLRVSPASKGSRFALATLDENTVREIERRAMVLPEDLRCMLCGPLEAFFVAREDDCMALVLYVRLRSR